MNEYLQTQLQTLRLFFDGVRVVNPITNQVLLQQEGEEFVTSQENIACYFPWSSMYFFIMSIVAPPVDKMR